MLLESTGTDFPDELPCEGDFRAARFSIFLDFHKNMST